MLPERRASGVSFLLFLLWCVLTIDCTHAAVITSISPTQGSIHGWTRVSILGTGFDIRGRSNLVYFGTGITGVYCDPIPNECTSTRIVCVTAPFDALGPMPVTVNSFSYNAICQVYGGCKFEYTILATPQVTMISPQWAIAPANITVYGSKFSAGDTTVANFDFTMWIGDEERCNQVSVMQYGSFICNVISTRSGYLPVRVILGASGMAALSASAQSVFLLPSITGVSPSLGSLAGGTTVTVYGTSFSPLLSDNYVTIHGAPCIVGFVGNAFLTCTTTPAILGLPTSSSARNVSTVVSSYLADLYYNLPEGYDLDLYWVGTIKYLQPDASLVLTGDFSYFYNTGCVQCAFRVTAQFVAPATGNYTFGINGDDYFEMWLSLNSEPVERAHAPSQGTGSSRTLDIEPFNPRRIISFRGCCQYVNSAPQALVANQSYWVRIFVKNGYGPGSLAGRVTLNGVTTPLQNYLRYSADYVAPVRVVVDDTPAVQAPSCAAFGSCDFNYASSRTPTITSVTPASVSTLFTLTVHGSMFDTAVPPVLATAAAACLLSPTCGNGGCGCQSEDECAAVGSLCAWSSGACRYAGAPPQCFQWSQNYVTVGGLPCNVTAQTASTLECTVPPLSAGYHAVTVQVGALGYASGVQHVKIDATIDGVYPSSGGLNGGNTLTIFGSGFNPAVNHTRVTVGGVDCAVTSVLPGVVTCVVPRVASPTSAAIEVFTLDTHTYTLPQTYQYDAKAVRPGTTTEILESSLSPSSGPATGATTVYITVPSVYGLSSASDVVAVIGNVPCSIHFFGGHQVQCLTAQSPKAGTFASWLSFMDKYGQGVSVELPDFTYYISVVYVNNNAVSAYGLTTITFQLSGIYSRNEVSVAFGTNPCKKFTLTGQYGSCTFGPAPLTMPARTVLQKFDFHGDGNAMTNPFNFVDISSGVAVDTNMDATIPAGGYVMTKQPFTRPFSVKALIRASRPPAQFSNADNSITVRACVTQNTLSSDGYRGIAAAPNASFYLLGGANSNSGRNTIQPDYALATFDTTSFVEHRVEVWNSYVRYYVNGVLIYSMFDNSALSGAVGVGFSAQDVTLRSLTVESLFTESFQVNVSGLPLTRPGAVPDVFYSTSNLPDAGDLLIDSTNRISLSRATSVDSNTFLVAADSAGIPQPNALVICPSFSFTQNPVTLVNTYFCTPIVPAGTYNAVLVSPYFGAGPSIFSTTVQAILSSVSPTSVALDGGRVTIFGSGFSAAVTVTVGGVPAILVTANSTMLIADLPARTASGSATLSVSVPGVSTPLQTAVSYTDATPFNITSVFPSQPSMWTTVTVTGTGFSSGVLVYFGRYAAQIYSVSSTQLTFNLGEVSASLGSSNVSVRIVQPGVGIARFTLQIVPYVYYEAPSVAMLSNLGGASVTMKGISLHAFTPDPAHVVATMATNFAAQSELPAGWRADPPFSLPARQTSCFVPSFGPFDPASVVSTTLTGLAAHRYVRVIATFSNLYSWIGTNLIVDSVVATSSFTYGETGASCAAGTYLTESSIVLRHTASTLSIRLQNSQYSSFSIISVTVELLSDVPYSIALGGVSVQPDVIANRYLTFTSSSEGMTSGTAQRAQLQIAGVDRCNPTACTFSVTNTTPSILPYATTAGLNVPNPASPLFVPAPNLAVTYGPNGTNITNTSVLLDGSNNPTSTWLFGVQNFYGSDGPVLRVRFRIQHKLPFHVLLASRLDDMDSGFGFRSYEGIDRYTASSLPGGLYLTPPQLVIVGEELIFEFWTQTNTVAFYFRGMRFAAAVVVPSWPLRLAVWTPAAISDLVVETTIREERVLLFADGLTQQPTNSMSSSWITATVGGAPCRSTFVTNGVASCFVLADTFVAGETVSATLTGPQGVLPSASSVLMRPSIESISPSVFGSNGNTRLTIRGGLLGSPSISFGVCGGPAVDGEDGTVACLSAALSPQSMLEVTAVSENATSFSLNSTALFATYPPLLTSSVAVDVVAGPQVDTASLDGDVLTVRGSDFPADGIVVLSRGSCSRTGTNNENQSQCVLSGVPVGSIRVQINSASTGDSNWITVYVPLTLISVTPATVGAGGWVQMQFQGSGFGSDGDGASVDVRVDGEPICSSISRMETVLTCTTLPGAFMGYANVTVNRMHYVVSTFLVSAATSTARATISAVAPKFGLGPATLTLTGTNLAATTAVYLGSPSISCAITSQTSTTLVCSTADDVPAATYRIVAVNGDEGANTELVTYEALLRMNTVTPGQGPKMGGQRVTIFGSGFGSVGQSIFLGGNPCVLAEVASTFATCYSTPIADPFSSDFDVTVVVESDPSLASKTSAAANYSYTSALTAAVSHVTPTVGSASGLELITIAGSGFGFDPSALEVRIGSNSRCAVQSAVDTEIICRTAPTAPADGLPVTVLVGSSGAATSTATFSFKLALFGIVGHSSFSLEGGAAITFSGEGFWAFSAADWQAAYYRITLDGWLDCPITSATWDGIVCIVPPSPRERTTTPMPFTSYPLRPNRTFSVQLDGNSILADAPMTLSVSLHEDSTPMVLSVTTSSTLSGGNVVTYGTVVTITGLGFASTGNEVTLGGSACTVLTQSTTRITCSLTGGSSSYGRAPLLVFVPGVGFAASRVVCPSGMFLACDGSCLADAQCQYSAWGATSCAQLSGMVNGDTFCNANGGTDATNTPFLTDVGTVFTTNCPMYSCEGNDCNTTLYIGGHGGVVSTCGTDPNGFLLDFRASVTAISGGKMSSTAGGLTLTIAGQGLPSLAFATVAFGPSTCAVLSATSTEIVCVTGASSETASGWTSAAFSVTVYGNGVPAVCSSASVCGDFGYSSAATPNVAGVVVSASPFQATITGSRFPLSDTSLISVTIGSLPCAVTSTSNLTVVCTPSFALSAGSQSVSVVVSGLGAAAGSSSAFVPLAVSSFSPSTGSLNGGTVLTISGVGFGTTGVTVSLGSSCSAVVSSVNGTTGVATAVTSACSASTASALTVRVGSLTATASATFSFSAASTPSASGAMDTTTANLFHLVLDNIGSATLSDVSIYADMNGAVCQIQGTASLPNVDCLMDTGYTAGSFALRVRVAPFGFATIDTPILAVYALSLSSVTPTSGYLGGNQLLTISGQGFGNDVTVPSVSINDVPCAVQAVESTSLICATGLATVSGTFDVTVTVRPANAVVNASAVSFSSYSYLSLSPTISSVSPNRGSTAGGTRLTIVGTNLDEHFTVSIAGVSCTPTSDQVAATAASGGTALYCTTGALHPMLSPVHVQVSAPSNMGDAVSIGNVTYQYIDLWSRWTTWGNSPPPQFGDSAVISEGQVVMIDYSPPRFFLIIVMGTLLFDDTTDIFLECTYIMINYGSFVVGTPEKPFTKKATIRLWGNRLTPEIPVHGSKVIALRYGSIDMHGVPRFPTWTRVAATAVAGVSSIFVRGPVDWTAGEFIVVSPTDFDPLEGEVRMIVAVLNGDTDNVTLVLEAPLQYTHFGERQCFGTTNPVCVDEIAEVGLLTRNVVVEGEPNSVNIGFGGTMFLMPLGDNASMHGRLSFIELRNVGQQYIVGRYPVHFHVTGTLSQSYVNGTSVHHSLNRAFSVHGISNMTYVNNVAYSVQGHCLFIEDGSERYNVVRDNMFVEVLATTSNLNTDITPAAIWVTAPMNYVDRNAVSGSQTFGIWIAPFDPHSTGPTYSPLICPSRQALGSMNDNVAHSNLWHGLHIFRFWFPSVRECDSSSPAAQAIIRNFIAYKNQIWGAALGNLEVGRVGAVILDNLTSADNGFENADGASFWIEKNTAPNMTCGLQNSVLIASSRNHPFSRSTHRRGVNLLQGDNFFVENVTFVNFNDENYGFEPQAWAHFKSLCFPYGWEAVTRGLRWINSTNRVLFRFQHHGILNDDDGTLTGVPGSQVVPKSPINSGASCVDYPGATLYPGLVCPNDYKIRRFGISTSSNPQLDQIWEVEGRVEINPQIDRQYVFTAPINRRINVTFQTFATPDWGYQFGGTTFMRPNEKALFVTRYLQYPYSVYTWFDGVVNTTYYGAPPTLNNTVSSYAFDNSTGILTVLLARPRGNFFSRSSICPPWGCPQVITKGIWDQKCHHVSDALAWSSGAVPTNTTDALIGPTTHICLGYNASVGSSGGSSTTSSERRMLEEAVGRTCTAENAVVTYSFSTLTVRGAISMRNDQCPCQGGTVIINIVKYLYVTGGGFLLGNETHPITDCKVRINILDVPWDAAPSVTSSYRNSIYGYRSIVFESGLFSLHGAAPMPQYTRLAATAAAASTTLTLESAVQWQPGDVIAIAATTRDAKYTLGNNRVDQSEQATIQSVSADGRTITLTSPLAFSHYGAVPQTLNGMSFRVGAEVAVLSRRISINGDSAADPSVVPAFGAGWKLRVGCTPNNLAQCTETRRMSASNPGYLQIEGVLFANSGQMSLYDGAVDIDGLTDGVDASLSYFRNNAFATVYAAAMYLRDATTNLQVVNNTIFNMWNDGLRVESAGNLISGNVAIRMNGIDPLCAPNGPYNIFWSCRNAMFRIHAGNTVLNNVAASGFAAGFLTEGDDCLFADSWRANVAHSTRDGVLVADSPAEPEWHWSSYPSPTSCRRISGVTTYWSSDHGLAVWGAAGNFTLANFVSVDDQIGTYVMTTHNGQFQNYVPRVWYTNITYSNRWNNVDFSCRANFLAVPIRATTLNSVFWTTFFTSTTNAMKVGNVGAMETVFASTVLGLGPTHGEHKNMWEELDQYSPVGGQAVYRNIHFANFDGMSSCGYRNLAFFQSHLSNDTFHQHSFQQVTWSNVAADGKLFPWRTYGLVAAFPTDIRTPTYFLDFNNYIHGAFWPDSPNKQMLLDLDGSFTQSGTGGFKTIVASETIPRTSTFTEIGYNGRAFSGGSLSPARAGCTWQASMNAFVCDSTHRFLSLNIDSLADDALTRRAGPATLCSGDGMMKVNGDPNCPGGAIDFASGPVMKGKVQRSTLDRLSRWRLWAEDNGNYTLNFRGVPPSWMRLQLQDYEYLGAGLNVGIVVNIRYFGENARSRVGVYVNGVRQPSTVGFKDPWLMSPPQQWPQPTDPAGTHYMNLFTDASIIDASGTQGFTKNVLYLTLRPGVVVDLIQEPIVQVQMSVAMTIDQFFAQKDTFVAALASVLGISASRIKFANIVAGTTRRRSGSSVSITVQIEADPSLASNPLSGGSGSGTTAASTIAAQTASLTALVATVNTLSTNPNAIAAAAGIPEFAVSGVSTVSIGVSTPRPAIVIASGTPYLALNVSSPNNSSYFNSTTVLDAITSWVMANFSDTAPYNTTDVDGSLALGNIYTDATTNITQFTVIFTYENNTFSYAALVNLQYQLSTVPSAVLPGYTVYGLQFQSNGYVPDGSAPPSSSNSALTPDNITKFAIGIGIGIAIVFVLGGAAIFHVVVVYPNQVRAQVNKEKENLKSFITQHEQQTRRQPDSTSGAPGVALLIPRPLEA